MLFHVHRGNKGCKKNEDTRQFAAGGARVCSCVILFATHHPDKQTDIHMYSLDGRLLKVSADGHWVTVTGGELSGPRLSFKFIYIFVTTKGLRPTAIMF